MADFRRWILALTVLALCVGGAFAQVGGNPGGGTVGQTNTPFTCVANSATVTPQLRAEGITEQTGDIVLQCTGGNDIVVGGQIPQTNITVFLNTQVTSRLLGNGTVSNASEAVLMIDEPGAALTGYGPAQQQTLCTTPATGCAAWVGTVTTTAGTFTGVPVTAAGGTTAAPNVYQGVVNPDGKSVTFFGVPILPPVTSGNSRVYRITNIRANATAIPAGATTPGYVQALISTNNNSIPLVNSQTVVGYVQTSLATSIRNAGNTGTQGSKGLTQCSGPSVNNGTSTSGQIGILRYSSLFGTAFKTRVVASGGSGSGTAATGLVQNVPGAPYTSESGMVLPYLTGNGWTAGLADFGTRFRAVFNNIPSGVTIYVTTTNIASGGNLNNPATAPLQTSTSSSYAQLVVSETATENLLGGAPTLSATGSNGGNTIVAFTPATGTNSVEAVWEVINSNTLGNQNFDFGVYAAYSSNVANNAPPAPSAVTVSMSYAPISTVTSASSSAPIPRFVDLGSGDNLALFNIAICTTNLLFPYVTTVTGFDTGLAISNTTMDPFGTGLQAGACTLYWYGNNNGGTTNTPIPNSTTATSAAPTIAAGTTWTTQASLSNMAGQGFTGYMIAVCNFQFAHGYAAVTDIGSRGLLTSYLALIIPSSNRGAPESLSH